MSNADVSNNDRKMTSVFERFLSLWVVLRESRWGLPPDSVWRSFAACGHRVRWSRATSVHHFEEA